jgi:hypothetical protein
MPLLTLIREARREFGSRHVAIELLAGPVSLLLIGFVLAGVAVVLP